MPHYSQLMFRTGAFECDVELACYHGSLPGVGEGGRRRRRSSSRGSPLLLSHDIDDSQPPNVSYASTHSLSSNSDDEEASEQEAEEVVGGANTTPAGNPMLTSQYMDWEHLDPSIEELRLFEEEQMRQALIAAKTSSSSSVSEQQRVARVQAQETEIYRQRLRRLDYNSTYMDYAALTSTGSSGAGTPSLGPLATPTMTTVAGDSFKSLGSTAAGEDSLGKRLGGKRSSDHSPEPPAESASGAQQGGVASGISGTLSSLWTSTFGGSRS